MSFSLRNILFGATILLMSAAANAASVTLVDVANSQVRSGAYAGFYTLKIDGQDVLAMCDDFSTTSTIGETWTAYFNTQGDINGGAGKFNPNTTGYHQLPDNPTRSTRIRRRRTDIVPGRRIPGRRRLQNPRGIIHTR